MVLSFISVVVPSWYCDSFLRTECPAGSVFFSFLFWFLQRSAQLVLSFFVLVLVSECPVGSVFIFSSCAQLVLSSIYFFLF